MSLFLRNQDRTMRTLIALLILFALLMANAVLSVFFPESPLGCLMFTHPRANALAVILTFLLPVIVQALLWVRLRRSAFWIALVFTPVSVVFLLATILSVRDQQPQIWQDKQDFSFLGTGLTDTGIIAAPGLPLHFCQRTDGESASIYLQQEQPLGWFCPGVIWARQVYYRGDATWISHITTTVRDAHHIRCTLVSEGGDSKETIDVTLP